MSPKITMTVHTIGVPLRIKLNQQFWKDVGNVIAGSTKQNILTQTTLTGGRLKQNAPSTMAAKRRAGRPQLSLIDKGRRLVSQGAYAIVTMPGGGVTVSPVAAKIARWVQMKGYTGWFGLSAKGRSAIKGLIAKEIKRLMAKNAKKKKKTKVVK